MGLITYFVFNKNKDFSEVSGKNTKKIKSENDKKVKSTKNDKKVKDNKNGDTKK